jgi:alkylhydroperoxidase/carboxymuconolactone decarboxylase family protein YurZ/quinol monooxygenase YgiN
MNYQMKAQESTTRLTPQDKSLVEIAALTASGNVDLLKTALAEGLDAGLTINQINDELAQLYAYCGFPRSLNAISTFMKVVEERKANSINDNQGKAQTSVVNKDDYEKGRKTLEALTGKEQKKPAPGFGEFNPNIDRFLKEHLFADIFDSDLLTYKQREMATIAALSAMQGVEPQLQAHLGMGTHVGISTAEMNDLLTTISNLGKENSSQPMNNARIEYLKFQLASSTAVDHEVSNNCMIRISEIEIYPEYFKEYIKILKEESAASIEKEPGVISIFPLVEKQNPTQIRIFEFYKDKDAYKSHIASPHFQYYKTTTVHMIKNLKLIDMYVIDAQRMPSIFEKLKGKK